MKGKICNFCLETFIFLVFYWTSFEFDNFCFLDVMVLNEIIEQAAGRQSAETEHRGEDWNFKTPKNMLFFQLDFNADFVFQINVGFGKEIRVKCCIVWKTMTTKSLRRLLLLRWRRGRSNSEGEGDRAVPEGYRYLLRLGLLFCVAAISKIRQVDCVRSLCWTVHHTLYRC